jgi:transcriptional regulator with XRE-family HTH domain
MRTQTVPMRTFVKDILEEKQMRASQLARELGVSHATVGRWLNGEDTPSPQSCHKLSQFTNIPVERILRIAGYFSGK